jgi:hypothetical protein
MSAVCSLLSPIFCLCSLLSAVWYLLSSDVRCQLSSIFCSLLCALCCLLSFVCYLLLSNVFCSLLPSSSGCLSFMLVPLLPSCLCFSLHFGTGPMSHVSTCTKLHIRVSLPKNSLLHTRRRSTGISGIFGPDTRLLICPPTRTQNPPYIPYKPRRVGSLRSSACSIYCFATIPN